MRTMLLTLGVCFLFPVFSAADDTKDNTIVKELDIKGLALVQVKARFGLPVEIGTAEEFMKAFPVKASQEKIKGQVNFDRHKLLYFAWSGSGQDKLTPAVVEEGGKKQVKFTFEPGRTRDYRAHFRLYLLGKDVPFTSPQ